MSDLTTIAFIALPVLYGCAVWLKYRHEKQDEQARNARIREIREENLELDRQIAETEANAARHREHLVQKKDFVPLVLPPKPSPEEQAKRDAAYQETVASRYRGVPVRQANLSRPGRFVTPNRPTQTDSSSRYQEDNSLTGTILTAVAVSSLFDSDSSPSSPDPAPSWDSSDSSSGSGFGGGGSSDSW